MWAPEEKRMTRQEQEQQQQQLAYLLDVPPSLLLLVYAAVAVAAGEAVGDNQHDLAAAHVFWSSAPSRVISSTYCAPPCGFMAVDETGALVAEGMVSPDGSVELAQADFGVGFYRLEFSRPGVNGTTAAVLRPPSAAATAWPPTDSPVAVDTSQSWEQPADPKIQETVSHLAAAAGCGWTRDRLRWSDLEPTRGNYAAPRSTVYDIATSAAAAAGIKVLEVFHSTPGWALDPSTDAIDGVQSSGGNMPRDLGEAFTFTKWLAQRFAGKVHAYEPWNEGNIPMFGGQSTDQRVSYQKAAFLGFKSGASNASSSPVVCNNVMAGAGSNITDADTFANGAAPFMQSFNIHTYQPAESYVEQFTPARRAAAAAKVPLWLTESGIHLPASTPAPWSDMTAADDWRQAAFVAPSFAVSFFAGAEKHFFFELLNYLERGLQFGLLRFDRTPRPGYSALATVGHFLAGAKPLGKLLTAATVHGRSEPLTSTKNAISDYNRTTSDSALPLAVAYVMKSNPGGGAAKDTVLVYCPPASPGGPIDPNRVCATPPELTVARVERLRPQSYDFLGRVVSNSQDAVPMNVTAAAVFVLLPAGSASRVLHLEPPPRDTKTRRDSSSGNKSQTSAARSNSNSTGDRLARAALEQTSYVVLQCQFPYGLPMNTDSHTINASGRTTACYAYNFRNISVHGTITATTAHSATVLPPSSWTLTIAAGERKRFQVLIVPPTGRAFIDNTTGGGWVTLRGEFGEPPSLLSFRVDPDVSTLTPVSQWPVPGSDVAAAWSHNIANGGTVSINASSNSGHSCVCFEFTFDAGAGDAWAYPQLLVKNLSVGTLKERDPEPDGIRGFISGVRSQPAIGAIKDVNSIFFDRNGTQFMLPLQVNTSDTGRQHFTLLFKDTHWNHNGPPPETHPFIQALQITQLAIGMNLASPTAGHEASMEVCGLEWVRF